MAGHLCAGFCSLNCPPARGRKVAFSYIAWVVDKPNPLDRVPLKQQAIENPDERALVLNVSKTMQQSFSRSLLET